MSRETLEGVRINVDFHGVIADLVSALVYTMGGPPPYTKDITYFDHPITTGVWEKLKHPGLYEWMPPIALAQSHINGMYQSGYEIAIVTDQPEEAYPYTLQWLNMHGFKFDDLHFLKDKNEAGPHILVDDKSENVWRYADAVGPAILFSQPWNREWSIPGTRYPLMRGKGWD